MCMRGDPISIGLTPCCKVYFELILQIYRGGVVAPDSSEDYIRAPRRLAFFDNILIRDLKLGNDVGRTFHFP